MSLNPVIGPAQPPDIAAIIADELASLAADAQTLGSQLTTGDVVTAVVLRSNGLTDLLDIRGLRVAAALPATLMPGDTITVMVTGFSDDRINLQIMPTQSGANHAPAAGEPPSSLLRTTASLLSPNVATEATTAAALPTVATAAALPIAAAPLATVGRGSAQARAADGYAATTRGASDATSPSPAVPAALKNIEARIAAAYATNSPAFRASAAGPAASSASRLPPVTAAVPRPVIGMRTASPAATPPLTPSAPARGPLAFTEPTALLRALDLPVTATNLAAARMALESPEKLPNALATLERALANSADPRVATLSTLTSFIARLEPRSPLLATQIAAFVDQVVTGREGKLAGFLSEKADAAAAKSDLPNPTTSADQRGALIRVALDYDLKTQLLALAAAHDDSGAPAPKSAALDAAVAGALTAITSLQLTAASALNASPAGLSFALPMALPDGFAQARVRIDRDVPGGKSAPLDGDNFHIAFVLETRRLGTIAIDLMTVGRAVTLSVKTEATSSQRRFGSALGSLTDRLEKLHYRVAAAEAVVAAPSEAPAASPRPVPAPADVTRLVDIDA